MSDSTTKPHGAWPKNTYRADWVPGAVDECVVCGRRIEFTEHPDDRPGGWRHHDLDAAA